MKTPTDDKPGEWLGLDRQQLTAWYSKKFALNKPEKDSVGLATWTKAPRSKEAA